MTDHEKRIREALEAVPLPHDWEVCQKPANEHWYAGRTIGAADPTDARRIADTCALSAHAEKFATYIAACNPSAIRALLADLDAVRGALKTLKTAVNYKAACLVSGETVKKVAFADDQVWKAVDEAEAALKGASHD